MFERRVKGFTLVELLVVIGIIALLISILLPALNRARASAQSVACLANLRSIGQSLAIYTAENKNWLPGSGLTTGRHFWLPTTLTNNTANRVYTPAANNLPPGPISPLDWIGPLASVMRIQMPSTPAAVDRYRAYRDSKAFLCPSASGSITTAFTGGGSPDAGPGEVLGYATAFDFLITPGGVAGVTNYTRITDSTAWWALPGGYAPKITKIGKTTEKIFVADAGKFFTSLIAGTYNLDPYADIHSSSDNAISSIYSDHGAFTRSTTSYDRKAANGLAANFDGRILSYRHGARTARKPIGSYRMNAVFYDGHAESLTEQESINPAKWLPAKTVIPASASAKLWPDTISVHNITFPYTVP